MPNLRQDPLRGARLARRLASVDIRLFARLGSTNRTAAALLEQRRLAAPALVAASRQTAGRGQRANRWWSDAGSLCATFVLPAADRPIGQVPLRAGLAVAAVLARHLPAASIQLKWPNDVLVEGAKIAGLLCMRVRGADLIGIGLNVRTDLRRAPAEVRARATAMSRHLRRPPRRDLLLEDLWHALGAAMEAEDWQEAFARRHALNGKRVRVEEDGAARHGVCRGVDAEGRLLLEDARGLHACTSGAVFSAST